MDLPQDDVCLFIATPSFPPPSNDAPGVTKEPEVLARLTSCDDRTYEEFKADCFNPPNVPSLSFPTWDEPPSSSMACNDNCNANS